MQFDICDELTLVLIHILIPLKIYRMPLAGLDCPAFIEIDCSNQTRAGCFFDHRIGGRAVIFGDLNHYSGTCLVVLSI